jgi:hypothetical protein
MSKSIPRDSKRYNTIKKMRSASEQANSTIKEDLRILDKPRVLRGSRANILAASRFMSKSTTLFPLTQFSGKTVPKFYMPGHSSAKSADLLNLLFFVYV